MFVSRNALLILGTVLCVLLYVSTSSIRLLLHHELDSKGSSLRSVRDQKENVSARDSQPERVSHSEKYVESLCARVNQTYRLVLSQVSKKRSWQGLLVTLMDGCGMTI